MRAIVASLLLLTLASLCVGCVVVPVPASVKTASCGKRISKEEASFIKIGQTTRAEVVSQFGQPFATNEQPVAIAYNWAVTTWNWYGVGVTGCPGLHFDNGPLSERSEVLLIQFDRDDCVRCYEFRRLSDSQTVKAVLCQWADTKPNKQIGAL